MDKKELQQQRLTFQFIVSSIYNWAAVKVDSSDKLSKDDFYIIAENMLESLKSSLTEDSKKMFNIARKDYEKQLGEKIFEQAKQNLGW